MEVNGQLSSTIIAHTWQCFLPSEPTPHYFIQRFTKLGDLLSWILSQERTTAVDDLLKDELESVMISTLLL